MKKDAVVDMTEKVINVSCQVHFLGPVSNKTRLGAEGRI